MQFSYVDHPNRRYNPLTEQWLAVVPYWAAWPFETLLLPKTHVLRITDLTNEQNADMVLALKTDQPL